MTDYTLCYKLIKPFVWWCKVRNIEEIRKILAGHKEELKGKFKVKRLAIFGSYTRNETKRGK